MERDPSGGRGPNLGRGPGRPPAGSFLDHARAPRNLGVLTPADGAARQATSCGDSLVATLRVSKGRISEIRFLPEGCGHVVACASRLGELVLGRRLEEALALTPAELVRQLPGLPREEEHCAELAVGVLAEAIADHRQRLPRGRGKG